MAEVGQYQLSTFTSPVNGTTPIDANVVRGQDNTIKTAFNSHDADATIHVQSSELASRPAAGTAGRFWVTTDGLRAYIDDGSGWDELAYLNSTVPATLTSTTSPQLTVAYDGSNHLAIGVSSAGAVTYNATGASAGHSFSDALTAAVGITVTTGGITVSAGGITVTGNSTVTGTLAVSSTLSTSGSLSVGAAFNMGFAGRSIITSPSDGILTLNNNAASGFTRLQFGGTTSSFPAIARGGTALEVKLADDSAFTALTAAFFVAGATNPASVGNLRFPNNTNIAWRNSTNSSDHVFGVNASDILVIGPNTAWGTTPATTGRLRLPNNESISWRNAANDGNLSLSVNASNKLISVAEVSIVNTGTNQLTVGYDGSNFLVIGVSSAGAITYNATGASAGHSFSDALTAAVGLTVTTGGITVSAGGVTVTGNSTITGTLGVTAAVENALLNVTTTTGTVRRAVRIQENGSDRWGVGLDANDRFAVIGADGSTVRFDIGDDGTVNLPTQALGTGVVSGPILAIGNNNSGNDAAGCIALQSRGGVVHYLWVDATGDLRINSAPPTEDNTSVSDTAGTVVGTQS